MGRAARHVRGKVIMYADNITGSMQRAIDETQRRRQRQIAYNEAHGIRPVSVQKAVRDMIAPAAVAEPEPHYITERGVARRQDQTHPSLTELIAELEKEMKAAAHALEFERAAELRDEIKRLKAEAEEEALS
jgi:excinuclease ABC subunit B